MKLYFLIAFPIIVLLSAKCVLSQTDDSKPQLSLESLNDNGALPAVIPFDSSANPIAKIPSSYHEVVDLAHGTTSNVMDLKAFLKSDSPWVKARAAQGLAMVRIEMGDAEQNKKIFPVFTKLMKDDDTAFIAVKHLAPIVRESPKVHLEPLVKPLIKALDFANARGEAISLLGEIGPMAKEALPKLKAYAESDAPDRFYAQEAIERIEVKQE